MAEQPIPKALRDQISDGSMILFLGAGASFDASHPKNQKPPTGRQLADMIAQEFLGEDYLNSDLQYVAELAISERNLYDVQKFVADIFKEFQPGPHHLRIPLYKWHSIYTTNYDLLIEDAYDQSQSELQTLATFIRNGERIKDKMAGVNAIMYNKLHGSITDINDPELPLILTPDQYVDHRKNRDRLFQRLKDDAYENSILFVGFSFADWDIRYILRDLEQSVAARPRSYMVGPNITPEESRLWDLKKISSLKLSFKEFISQLQDDISENARVLSTLKESSHSHPIEKRFQSQSKVPSIRLMDFLKLDVTYIHNSLAEKNTDPKEFYKGYFEGWDPIIKGYDVQRELTETILSEVFLIEEEERLTNQELYLIKGNAGSGKTVLLHRIAWEAAVEFEKLCLFYKSDVSIDYDRLAELFNLTQDRIYLFIDDVSDKSEDIEYILSKAKKDRINISIIGADRTNVWNIEGERLNIYLTRGYFLGYLNDDEVDRLIDLLDKYNSLGYLSSKSPSERKMALSEQSGRELLVALYEATAGKPFADIVLDEYNSIRGEEARELYLTICMFHRIGAYARAGNISRLHDISFTYFKEKLFKPLEYVVYHKRNYYINDYVFTTRHQYIAELVFEQVLYDQESRLQKYIRIISTLDVDFESDKQVFVALTNAKKLMATFKDPTFIRTIFEVARENVGEEPALLQQQSIFEMTAEGGSLEKAASLLKKAHSNDPENVFISHSKAEFLLRKAEKSSQKLAIEKYLNEAKVICKGIISNRRVKNKVHSYHTLLKIYLFEIEQLFIGGNSELLERKIQEFEKTINRAFQQYPKESFLFEAEANFNQLIKRSPEALESLSQAFELNKRSPYLATRLSNYYYQNDQLDKALEILKTSIDKNSNDKDLNYKYARLLMEARPEDYINVKHYLRRSFVKKDKRYEAQFWYARTVYLLGESECHDFWNYLKEAPVDFRLKTRPRGIVTEDGDERIYDGTVIKAENSYGFVKQDYSGEDIYFHIKRNSGGIRFNSRVKFKKAFNYNGMIAVIQGEDM